MRTFEILAVSTEPASTTGDTAGERLTARRRLADVADTAPDRDTARGVHRLVKAAQRWWGPGRTKDRFEGYAIGPELGRGTVGIVYAAHRKRDGQQVALKTLHVRVPAHHHACRRFLREIEVTSRLRHPNIVQLLDSAPDGSKAPVSALAPLMTQCLDGLQYAHSATIVHRDLKPENILLSGNGVSWTAKIADMGLAKNFQSAGVSGMTLTGEPGGTLAFMPREQLTQFKYAKPANDIWSIAATFYYALTGAYPLDFPAHRDAFEVVLHDEPVPIRNRDSNLPVALASVFDRALSVNPTHRYESAAEMKAAVLQALSASGSRK